MSNAEKIEASKQKAITKTFDLFLGHVDKISDAIKKKASLGDPIQEGQLRWPEEINDEKGPSQEFYGHQTTCLYQPTREQLDKVPMEYGLRAHFYAADRQFLIGPKVKFKVALNDIEENPSFIKLKKAFNDNGVSVKLEPRSLNGTDHFQAHNSSPRENTGYAEVTLKKAEGPAAS